MSTKDQKDHGTSLEYQEEKIRECIEAHGWVNVGILKDNQTGTEIDKRESMTKIMKTTNMWDVLVITKPDRLSRSMGDAENMFKRVFEPNNKNVWSIEMNINLTNHPEMRQFKAVIADMEVRNIRSRVKQGLETASDQGYWIGKPPLGYRTQSIGRSAKDRKILVPDENAGKINEIFRLASDGLSAGDISREVGIPRTTIIDILKNPVYYGWRRLTKRSKTKNTDDIIVSAEETVTWVPHKYQIIVDKEYLNSCKGNISYIGVV